MDGSIIQSAPGEQLPYIIVLGNEKGGTGKSTTAMHLIVALLKVGFKVGSVDLDSRRASLTRYVANRTSYAEETGEPLALPAHRHIAESKSEIKAQAEAQERSSLRKACAELAHCNFIIIDTLGSDTYLSRVPHENADILITPLNDSFLDIDMLAQIDRKRREVLAPSTYSQMVWEQNNRRVLAGQPPIDWIVMRNRLTHIEARNKRNIADLLVQLARRIGFRIAPGFGERVVFREMFLNGLTLMDLPEEPPGLPPNPSHVSARQEIRSLLETVGLMEKMPA